MKRNGLQRAVALAALACALTACGTFSVDDEKKLGAQYQAQCSALLLGWLVLLRHWQGVRSLSLQTSGADEWCSELLQGHK